MFNLAREKETKVIRLKFNDAQQQEEHNQQIDHMLYQRRARKFLTQYLIWNFEATSEKEVHQKALLLSLIKRQIRYKSYIAILDAQGV